MDLIIIGGLSGSGKSVALDMLEDLDYFCVDNIPARILRVLIDEMIDAGDPKYEHVAVGLDTRPQAEDLDQIAALIGELRQQGIASKVLFLQAETKVLLKRYSETRRKHPLSSQGLGLGDAIAFERELLAPISDLADLAIDTSRMSVHDLREAIRDRLADDGEEQLAMLFKSFGFKNGIPGDADFVFDARFLPNPFWEGGLRGLTGRDAPVMAFLAEHGAVANFIDDIAALLERWIPEILKSNRSYMTVAIGCTGGQHRSVYIAERLAERFGEKYPRVLLRHSELSD